MNKKYEKSKKETILLNDIISLTNDTMEINQAYVKDLSDEKITIIFAPQKIDILSECTYTGTGEETYTHEDFNETFEIFVYDNISDAEREEIIEKINDDISTYKDNKALATVILNAVNMLEEITDLSKERIYQETYQHGGVGEQLSLGKVYNFTDEMLDTITYNTFVILEESNFSKEDIIRETGISEALYNRVNS